MKKLLLGMALLGVALCKAVQTAPHIQKNLNRITLNHSLQINKTDTSLVGQLQQIAKKPRCKNLCNKFQVTAFSVPYPRCSDGNPIGAIAFGITGGTPPFTFGGNFEGTTSLFSSLFLDVPNGSYNLEVVDSKGCFAQQTVIVTNTCTTASCNNFKLFARNVPQSICPNNKFPGSIALSVEGAVGPIGISFFKDNKPIGTFQQIQLSEFPFLVGPFQNGTYNIVASDDNLQCIIIETVIVNNTCPFIPQCASPLVSCCTK